MELLFVPKPSLSEKVVWALVFATVLLLVAFVILSIRLRYLDTKPPSRSPVLATRYRNFADAWIKQGKVRPAVGGYTQAIRHEPKPDGPLYWSRGDAWMLLKNYAEAGRDYDQAIELAPRMPYPLMAKAMSLALGGRFKESVGFAGRAIRLDRRFELAYFWKGFSEEKLGRLAQAESDYDKAIGLNSSAGNYYLARAVVRLKRKNFPGAKEDIDRALKLNSQLEDTPLMRSIRQVYGQILRAP